MPAAAAALLKAHWALGGAGVILVLPLPKEDALHAADLADHLERAEQDAAEAGLRGAARTPFLLDRLAKLTNGATLRANQTLILANARLAARVAAVLLEGA